MEMETLKSVKSRYEAGVVNPMGTVETAVAQAQVVAEAMTIAMTAQGQVLVDQMMIKIVVVQGQVVAIPTLTPTIAGQAVVIQPRPKLAAKMVREPRQRFVMMVR